MVLCNFVHNHGHSHPENAANLGQIHNNKIAFLWIFYASCMMSKLRHTGIPVLLCCTSIQNCMMDMFSPETNAFEENNYYIASDETCHDCYSYEIQQN